MPISFNCPKCQKKLSVQDNMGGKVAKCPCGTHLKIPAPTKQKGQPQPAGFSDPLSSVDLMSGENITSTPLARTQQLSAASTDPPATAAIELPQDIQELNPDFQIQCVQCGKQYRLRPDLLGQTVACKCGAPIRFDDPLGEGGSLINNDPLGLADAAPNQPLAYQSQSRPSTARKKVRDREEEVLKMYIKDDGLGEKKTKSGKTQKNTSTQKSKAKSKDLTQYKLATPVQRLIACIIDCFAIVILGLVLGMVAGGAILGILAGQAVANDPDATSEAIAGAAYLGAFIGSFLGMIIGVLIISIAAMIWETFGGSSLGKLLLGLRVSNADGTLASLDTKVKRGLIKFQYCWIPTVAILTSLGWLIPISGILDLVLFVGIFFIFGESRRTFWDRLASSCVVTRK